MTDTPISPQTYPPPSKVDVVKGLLGDLARPFGVITNSGASAIVSVLGAVNEPSMVPAILAADAVILGIMWAAKTVEVQQAGKQAASIEIAKSTTVTP